MKVTGKITKILPTVEGETKQGKQWKKLSFLVETTEQYNNLYHFELFGEDKVDKFLKFNSVGQDVDVSFNVRTNEDKGRYFTSLQAWSIFKADSSPAAAEPAIQEAPQEVDNGDNSLPF